MNSFFKAIIFILGLSMTFNTTAQDIHFSNYLWSPSTINPALIGIRKNFESVVHTRRQWASISEPFVYYQINSSYPFYLKPKIADSTKENGNPWGSSGLSFISGSSGPGNSYKTNRIAGSFAYNIPLSSSNILTSAIQVNFINYYYSLAHLNTGSQWTGTSFDPGLFNGESISSISNWNFDLSYGLLWNHHKDGEVNYYSGLSLFNLMKLVNSKGKTETPICITYVGGIKVYEKNYFSIHPKAQAILQTKTNNVIIGSDFKYELSNSKKAFKKGFISAGVHYRTNDAVILATQFDQPAYTIGFSYDINSSSLGRDVKNANAFELFLSYKIKVKRRPRIIEETVLYTPAAPEKTTFVKIMIFDSVDSSAINATFKLKELDTKTYTILESVDLKDTLHILKLILPQKSKFEVEASLNNYLYKSLEVTTTIDTIISNIYLSQIKDANKEFIPGDILFKDGSIDLDSNSYLAVQLLKDRAKLYPQLKIRITGHADDKGNDEVNMDLSVKRANTVAKYLKDSGIDPSKISIEGQGKSKTLYKGKSRGKNRRVEVLISQ